MKQDTHALLSIDGLPQMDKRTITKLVKWLRSVAEEIEKEDKKAFASPCRFRLLKKI